MITVQDHNELNFLFKRVINIFNKCINQHKGKDALQGNCYLGLNTTLVWEKYAKHSQLKSAMPCLNTATEKCLEASAAYRHHLPASNFFVVVNNKGSTIGWSPMTIIAILRHVFGLIK